MLFSKRPGHPTLPLQLSDLPDPLPDPNAGREFVIEGRERRRSRGTRGVAASMPLCFEIGYDYAILSQQMSGRGLRRPNA